MPDFEGLEGWDRIDLPNKAIPSLIGSFGNIVLDLGIRELFIEIPIGISIHIHPVKM